MPNVKLEMYPRRWLDPEAFEKGKVFLGTIEKVKFSGAFLDKDTGVEKPVWELHFREFEKPLKLNQSKSNILAEILDSDETDDWVGRRIGFYRGVESFGGKAYQVFLIDQRLPEPLNPMLDRTAASMYFKPEWGKSVVPTDNVTRFLEKAKWEDFLKWLKLKDDRALSAAFGCGLDQIPGSVIPAMKAYLDELAGVKPPETVDKVTGEVIERPQLQSPPPPGLKFSPPPMGVAAPAAASAQPAAKPTGYEHPQMQEINSDDIPF